MSPVEYRKSPCDRVEFQGREPLSHSFGYLFLRLTLDYKQNGIGVSLSLLLHSCMPLGGHFNSESECFPLPSNQSEGTLPGLLGDLHEQHPFVLMTRRMYTYLPSTAIFLLYHYSVKKGKA